MTHTHTHTHLQVHSLKKGVKKGVSENEAPGPVGAYTTTHNNTPTPMLNRCQISFTESHPQNWNATIAHAGCRGCAHTHTHFHTHTRFSIQKNQWIHDTLTHPFASPSDTQIKKSTFVILISICSSILFTRTRQWIDDWTVDQNVGHRPWSALGLILDCYDHTLVWRLLEIREIGNCYCESAGNWLHPVGCCHAKRNFQQRPRVLFPSFRSCMPCQEKIPHENYGINQHYYVTSSMSMCDYHQWRSLSE